MEPNDSIHRWKQDCLRKRKFPNKRVARIRTKGLARETRRAVYFYECEHCEFWHLTSMKWIPGKKDNKGVSP